MRLTKINVQASAGWARTWFVGYQSYKDPCGWWTLDLFAVPFVRLTLRLRDW